jgi:lipoprotein NlpD
MVIRTLVLLFAATVAGCVTRTPAPVSDRRPADARTAAPRPAVVKPAPPAAPAAPRAETYTVKAGDTLYSIALDNGLDYRELAAWNNLDNAAVIRVGQQLRLTPPPRTASTAPLRSRGENVEARPLDERTPAPRTAQPPVERLKTGPKAARVPYSEQAWAQANRIEPVPPVRADAAAEPRTESAADAPREVPAGDWVWPAPGKIVAGFNGSTSKGIDIAGRQGESVLASAPGRVIFSGTGVRGLGKFIVIKHNNEFISVYGHNSELLVKQDQVVTRGQKIAEMGNTDSDRVKLHFQIRRFGTPVDPLKLLPDRG